MRSAFILIVVVTLASPFAACTESVSAVEAPDGGSEPNGDGGGAGAVAEANIKADVPAARAVFDAGVPLVVAPLDATVPLKLDAPTRKRLFDAYTLLTMQVQAMHQLWDQGDPVLYDAAAAALAFSEKHFTMQDVHLTVDEQGMTRASAGKANARVATAVDGPAFLKWFVDRVTGFGQRAPLRPLRNFTSVIDPGPMPRRVHAFENYETDIERRWWMSGKAETVLKPDAPPGNRRACRAVLTQDFDDLMGDMKSMYRAVIFNPVPGPPMGPRTRLSFRYWLKGTDELRVQLYSLSNGYHRYLAVKDLPQGQWRHAAVDMTQMRRPDGSGGPLSENERIDDIQFYVDPKAELVIDDVVLYDAPPEGPPEVAPRGTDQTRPFPQRLLFTGWFDTGKQGREWPGDFEIVAHEPPRTWKAAKSIARQPGGEPWIRLSLRGQRELGKRTELRFDYHLKGATTMRIELVNSRTKRQLSRELDALASGKWSRTTLAFTVGDDPQSPGTVDEVRFILPKGAELLLDDLLLYVPGTER